MAGRILAIGDVHGHAELLDALLKAVAPAGGDVVVTLGDYVDRGPDSCGVLNRLLRLSRTANLVALRGNHEQMMLEARTEKVVFEDWLLNGGGRTLASYSPFDDEGRLADVLDEHWEFLEKFCVDWHETATHFFVHAGAYADLPLAEQPTFKLRWDPFDDPPPWCAATPARGRAGPRTSATRSASTPTCTTAGRSPASTPRPDASGRHTTTAA